MEQNTEQFYSTFEVAKMCHVSPASVTRWINDGVLQAAITVGGHKRIRGTDIAELLHNLKMPIPAALQKIIDVNGSSKRILIVDDDEQIRGTLVNFFKRRFPAFEVSEASDGFKAGWVAHGSHPDLIVLDLMIPGFDGFRVCSFIRSFPELSQSKIIAITGHGHEHEGKIRELGADDFLSKPFDWKVLEKKIAGLLMLPSFEGEQK